MRRSATEFTGALAGTPSPVVSFPPGVGLVWVWPRHAWKGPGSFSESGLGVRGPSVGSASVCSGFGVGLAWVRHGSDMGLLLPRPLLQPPFGDVVHDCGSCMVLAGGLSGFAAGSCYALLVKTLKRSSDLVGGFDP